MSSPNLTAALQHLAETAPAPPRRHRPREVGVMLVAFSCCALLLESEALLTWVQRFEANDAQARARTALTALSAAAEAVGLTAPRRALLRLGGELAAAVGLGREDPWGRVEQLAAVVEAPALEEHEAPEAPLPAIPEPEPSAGPKEPMKGDTLATVLLTGDSLIAGGLATTLSRTLARRGDLRAVHAFRIGTGLANPDLFDWAAEVPALVAREDPQLVICSLGANDGVALREGERVLAFGDNEWSSVYRQRVVGLMRALAAHGARVLWLGLPPMRDKRLAARAKVLNRIFAQAADQVPRVEYLEVGMLFSDPDGGFATYVKQGDGRRARLRLDDGVHYSPAGARAIARWVMDWVRERFPQTRPPAPSP